MANWYSEAESECRKHPEEKPHPGVCPSCLRERLSRIAAAGNINYMIDFYNSSNSASCSSSPPRPMYDYFHHSGSSSGDTSPRRPPHNRTASDILDSIYIALSGSRCNSTTSYGNGLRKSRSIAFAPRINGNEGSGVNRKNQKKKKAGFWSKLLHRSSVNVAGGKKARF